MDERGRVVDGDQILYVCGVYLNKHGRLSGGTVVPTIASNFGLIKSLELAGLSAVTSGVGDRHVYAKMREGGYSWAASRRAIRSLAISSARATAL